MVLISQTFTPTMKASMKAGTLSTGEALIILKSTAISNFKAVSPALVA